MATSKQDFLATLPIFAELYEDELDDLARISDEYDFEDGAVLAYQRDVADTLIIVRSGRLFAYQVDNRGIVRDSRSLMPGDYFNDAWLFTPLTHDATVRGAGSGRVILIPQAKFLKFLARHPGLFERLALSEDGEREGNLSFAALPSRKYKTLSLVPEELVEYEARRSPWLLFFQAVWPALGLVVLLFLSGREYTTPGANIWLIIGPLVPAFILFLVLIFQLVDWSNDYFYITSKHLIHREFDLRRFRATINKTPIDQIQSVEVEKPNLLATILNTGTARVTTSAQSGIFLFNYIDDPIIIKNTIDKLRARVQALDAGREQATMRASIEEHFQANPGRRLIKEEETEAAKTEEDETQVGLIGQIARAVRYRVEDGQVITYRKHMFTLIGQTWKITALLVLLLLGVLAVPSLEVALVLLLLLAVAAGVFIWQFEDWRNDTFQVTDRYVIDIDRRPFGFGESRKQADLGNVQNVNADKPGILATIFNYGNVYIETAGATADITFETVANPNQIQSDIFRRREQFRQKQRVAEGARRRKEYAVLLDVYQQAREQQRIPRRTPPQDI